MKRFVLALPVAFLLLSSDRIGRELGVPPTPLIEPSWESIAPTLPARNEGRWGRPGDPLNLVFLAAPAELRAALTEAGWTEVPTTIRGSLRAGFRELREGRRIAAFPPMNDYRLLERRQAMNWALPVRFLDERHHFRLWHTGRFDPRGRAWWWGSGNYDLSVRWRDLSHRPDPDMNRERDFVASSLARSPRLEAIVTLPHPAIPREGVNDKGYPFVTDGRVAVILLR